MMGLIALAAVPVLGAPEGNSRFDLDTMTIVVERWNPLDGAILDVLPGFTVFESDTHTFWPDADIWRE